MAAAWIGFAGGLIAAVISAIVAIRQSRVEAEVQERLMRLERDLRADEVLKRYREPLAAAAFDLQSRLYNILRKDFLGKFGTGQLADEAMWTTLFRMAQYFGWTEVLRRDIQFLSFPEDESTRRVAGLQSEIARRFLTDEPGHALMIWNDEQRGLGERLSSARTARSCASGTPRSESVRRPSDPGADASRKVCRTRPHAPGCGRCSTSFATLSRASTSAASAIRAISSALELAGVSSPDGRRQSARSTRGSWT